MGNAIKVVHNETEILYNEHTNVWEFVLRGRSRTAESLTKAREFIDKEPAAKKEKLFEPFDALICHYGHDYRTVRVTSCAGLGYGGKLEWWISYDGKRTKMDGIYGITPENQKRIAHIEGLRKQVAALEEEILATHRSLELVSVPDTVDLSS